MLKPVERIETCTCTFLGLNIAYSGVKALCSSSHIQAHICIPDTAKGIGWNIRDGRAE